MSFSSVLVANRGEIARRVFSTCRQRGLTTVAVHSDADAGAPFVSEADIAVRLPGDSPAQTYLDQELIISAARRSGAEAIHPGYGFLSENADFADAVRAAGLVWIGPPPQAMRQMASKIESKRLMDRAGVPVLQQLEPGQVTEDQLPVIIKASAGGGGRGMRVINSLAELQRAWDAASREASSAFGDGAVFCERYLTSGHHIEVQVFADTHGGVWALGERECSVQRRHQKVVEEAPAPLVERIGPQLREALFAASERAAEAIGYVGAGTIEFLADDDGAFHFLEMNTRLQVEHPVTEQTLGIDLVGLQLDIAAGAPLPIERPGARGSAIEVRLYAEDPAEDYRPQTGTLLDFEVPHGAEFTLLERPGVRLDSGVVAGSVVGTHYDSMLAKIISWAPDREQARTALRGALTRTRTAGIRTNADFLVAILDDPGFVDGTADTSFLSAERVAALSATRIADAELHRMAAAAVASELTGASGFPAAWRNTPPRWAGRDLTTADGRELTVRWYGARDGLRFAGLGEGAEELRVSVDQTQISVTADQVTRRYRVRADDLAGERRWWVAGSAGELLLTSPARFLEPTDRLVEGSLVAPMPGVVLRIDAAAGDRVSRGQPLMYLEAMKMEHAVLATADGILTEVQVAVGDQVTGNQVLAVLDGHGPDGES